MPRCGFVMVLTKRLIYFLIKLNSFLVNRNLKSTCLDCLGVISFAAHCNDGSGSKQSNVMCVP